MKKNRRQTIRGKFLRVTIPLIFLTVIGIFSVIELMTHQNALDRLQQTLDGMIVTQSAALATPLWNLDHDQIELSLEAIAANREIIAARIYGEDGALMLEVGEGGIADEHLLLQRDVIHAQGPRSSVSWNSSPRPASFGNRPACAFSSLPGSRCSP